ncbi:hypothetical protein E2C01_021525 [Portunus trituberculatus]|uniref:Uncharacterized protein n=1 Tax=Portunus trituberculatus TaxID=210409 RepID=A0A5B7E6B6_PORTR|nr:hypothetical protein [Portunus trituberculatus]
MGSVGWGEGFSPTPCTSTSPIIPIHYQNHHHHHHHHHQSSYPTPLPPPPPPVITPQIQCPYPPSSRSALPCPALPCPALPHPAPPRLSPTPAH